MLKTLRDVRKGDNFYYDDGLVAQFKEELERYELESVGGKRVRAYRKDAIHDIVNDLRSSYGSFPAAVVELNGYETPQVRPKLKEGQRVYVQSLMRRGVVTGIDEGRFGTKYNIDYTPFNDVIDLLYAQLEGSLVENYNCLPLSPFLGNLKEMMELTRLSDEQDRKIKKQKEKEEVEYWAKRQ